MLKATVYNVQDTNIANLGSELETKVRVAAAETEESWKEAGKVEGTQVWRIENFTVASWPKERHGDFYSGDSYIVLHTYKKAEKLLWDVHFWLGKHTTTDEAGTAAYKTVELDDVLGGAPVQHREVQGHESSRFTSYFKQLRTLDGGVSSGFNHVEPESYRPRLLHVKGRKNNVQVREVALSHTSLNSGDVFIYDGGLKLYQWNGKNSGGMERARGAQVCRAIDDERKGEPTVTVFEEGDSDLAPFWDAIGGEGDVMTAEEGGDDNAVANTRALYRLSDESGSLTFTHVATGGDISRSQLDSSDAFIFDAGLEVFVWIGTGASTGEKKSALQYAQEYLTKNSKDPNTSISRILEGGENEVFEALFT